MVTPGSALAEHRVLTPALSTSKDAPTLLTATARGGFRLKQVRVRCQVSHEGARQVAGVDLAEAGAHRGARQQLQWRRVGRGWGGGGRGGGGGKAGRVMGWLAWGH